MYILYNTFKFCSYICPSGVAWQEHLPNLWSMVARLGVEAVQHSQRNPRIFTKFKPLEYSLNILKRLTQHHR